MNEPTEVQSEPMTEDQEPSWKRSKCNVHIELHHPINRGKSKQSHVVFGVADGNSAKEQGSTLKVLRRNKLEQLVLSNFPMMNVVTWDIIYLDSDLMADTFVE